MDRVFLDANILFSAAYYEHAGLARLWDLKNVILVTSTYAVDEARRNLQTKKPDQLPTFERSLRSVEIVGDPTDDFPLLEQVILPGKDRPILKAAIAGAATHLVTGDVTHFGPYYGQTIEGVIVLSPGDYLRMHGEQAESQGN